LGESKEVTDDEISEDVIGSLYSMIRAYDAAWKGENLSTKITK